MARIVLVAGGYRTGSTLQYNLLGEYLEHARLGRRIGYVLPDDAEAVVGSAGQIPGFAVAKCHQVAEGFRPFRDEAAWAAVIRRGAAVVVTTTRSRPDVERSMCRKFGIDPERLHDSLEWRENEANVASWKELETVSQTYVELTTRPRRALRQLLAQLGIPIKLRSVQASYRNTRTARVLQNQARVPSGEWDPVSLVHWNHIER